MRFRSNGVSEILGSSRGRVASAIAIVLAITGSAHADEPAGSEKKEVELTFADPATRAGEAKEREENDKRTRQRESAEMYRRAALPRLAAGTFLPRLPAPFALPDLSHPSPLDVRLDMFLGRISPKAGDRSGAMASIIRPSFEASILVPRRLFVGVSYPMAVALPPDGGLATGEVARPSGTRTLFGNLEAHIRAVFPLPEQLEIGFTLGVIAPTAAFDRGYRPNRSAADAAASMDPTSWAQFLPDRVVLRPGGDLRIVRGPLVFQARHGIDVIIDDQGFERAKAAGRLLGHIGLLLRPDLEASIEGSQLYFFASDDKVIGPASPERTFAETYRLSDGRRSAFTVGSGLTYAARRFDIGTAIVTSFAEPLSPVANAFVALRVSVTAHFGRWRPNEVK